MSLPTTPIKTPEFKVEELYPKEIDYTDDNWFQLHTRAFARKSDKNVKHKGRVLKFGSTAQANRAFEKKMKLKMKWHPADKAREAEKAIQGIDAGVGYKIQIVQDDSVDPPAMPPTPVPSPLKNLNTVLMEGAEEKARKKTVQVEKKDFDEKIKEKENSKLLKKPPPVDAKELAERRKAVAVRSCFGCGLFTCLNKDCMDLSIATANSMKDTEDVVRMSGDERCEWFLGIYMAVDPSNRTNGFGCAKKYGEKMMKYSTDQYLLERDAEEAKEFAEDSTYVSSQYERYCEYQEAWEEEQLALAEAEK